MNYLIKKLGNGLKLLVISDKSIDDINISLTIKAGSFNEEKSNNGVAHLIEHLILPSTETDHGSNLKEITELKAELDLSIDKEYAYFNGVFGNKSLEKTLIYLKDMVFKPKFRDETIEREKNIVYQEIERSEDDVIYQIEELADSNIFKEKHGFKLPLLGSRESIEKITTGQVKKYHQKHYIPSNTTLAIASSYTRTKAFNIVKEIFSSLKKQELAKTKSQETTKQSITTKDYNRNNRVYLKLDFNSFDINTPLKNKIILGLLSEYLTEFQNSPLIQKLRVENNLIYDIYTQTQYYDQVGIFSIITDVNKKDTVKVIKTILKELDKLKIETNINKDLLTQARQYLNRENLKAENDLETKTNWLQEEVMAYGKLKNSPKKVINIREKITRNDISKTAKQIFNTKYLHISALGPTSRKEIEKALEKT